MDDLIERLRDCAQGVDLGADGLGWSPDPALLHEAASEIERLRAQVAELEPMARRYEWLRSEHQRYDPMCHLSWKEKRDRTSSVWVNTHDLDAALDAALAAQEQSK